MSPRCPLPNRDTSDRMHYAKGVVSVLQTARKIRSHFTRTRIHQTATTCLATHQDRAVTTKLIPSAAFPAFGLIHPTPRGLAQLSPRPSRHRGRTLSDSVIPTTYKL